MARRNHALGIQDSCSLNPVSGRGAIKMHNAISKWHYRAFRAHCNSLRPPQPPQFSPSLVGSCTVSALSISQAQARCLTELDAHFVISLRAFCQFLFHTFRRPRVPMPPCIHTNAYASLDSVAAAEAEWYHAEGMCGVEMTSSWRVWVQPMHLAIAASAVLRSSLGAHQARLTAGSQMTTSCDLAA